MIPQARGFPALPSTRLLAFPPFPKSSSCSVTTKALPTIPLGPPDKDIKGSIVTTSATPSSLASTFPKSPIWRIVDLGPP